MHIFHLADPDSAHVCWQLSDYSTGRLTRHAQSTQLVEWCVLISQTVGIKMGFSYVIMGHQGCTMVSVF